MKIGFVLDGGLERPDGVQQYILMLGQWMTAQGHEVRYIIAGSNPLQISNVISLSRNVPVRFNGNKLSIPLPASNRRVKEMLTVEKFDVIHVQTPHSPLMGAKVVRYAAPTATIVGTFHILPFGWLNRTGTRLLGVWLRRNLRLFDAFLSVSSPAALFAHETFRIDAQVVPNMVDIAAFKRSSQKPVSDTLQLLFLGRLVHRKGCQQLLQALALLHKQGKLSSSVRLDICGDGEMRKDLEQFVHDNGLQEIVTFHGFVTNEQKITFMQNADISIFPSLSGDPFGIVLIEAMAAAGGVALGGNNPGYESVLAAVPESIIEAANPVVMAEQIGTLLENVQQRELLYRVQQKHVEQFDVNVVAAKVLSVYEACINQRSNQ